MSFSASDLVAKEVDKIISIKNNATKINYDIVLHTGDGDINITMLETIEIVEDYNNNVGDYKLVNFLVGAGVFNFEIKPYSHNLEMSILKYVDNELIYTDTYKAVILSLDNTLSDLKGNYKQSNLDKTNMIRVSIQLVIKELEVIRSLKVDGVYKYTFLKDLMLSCMNKGMNSVEVNAENVELNMNISEPDNDNFYNHLIIPTGVRLLDLPTYLQDKNYGVYNGDMGVYFKKYIKDETLKLNLFVYPLYTIDESPKKELFIYHTNNPYLDNIDTTYKVVGDIVKIISTSEINMVEPGENGDIDMGNVITGSDPYSVTDYNAVVTNDNILFDKTLQISGQKSYDREDGISIENYVGNESNLYKHRSKVNERSLGLYQITWNYTDSDLLIPGMVTTLFYQSDKEVKQLKGVLQNSFTVYNESTKTTSTLLNIKMKRYEDE